METEPAAAPPRWLAIFFPIGRLSPRLAADPVLIRIWLREVILYWTRWGAVLLLVLALLLFPTGTPLFGVLVLIGLSTGNLAFGYLLLRQGQPAHVSRLRLLATASDWFAALCAMIVFTAELASIAPISSLAILITSSIRYRLPGIALAFVGATALIVLWTSLHLLVFEELSTSRVRNVAIGWAVALAWFALLQALVICGGQAVRTWEQRQLDVRLAGYERERSGLTRREWQLLPLLARTDLRTYQSIGEQLKPRIAGKTVDKHVRNIAEKLDLAGGRWEVVAEARKRGYIVDDPSTLENDGE